MKLSQILFKQHIGRAFRALWQNQRMRSAPETPGIKILSSMGLPVHDPSELVKPKKERIRVDVEFLKPRINFDETHPDWKYRPCLTYGDSNVLQAGVLQACRLTKTVKLEDSLPSQIDDLMADIPENVDNLVKRIIYTSTIYDSQQVKLPKIKDPNRPAWVFPRIYGISTTRKMQSLARKFLQLCESLNGPSIAQNRFLIHGGVTSVCIDKESDLIKLLSNVDLMVMATTGLPPISDPSTSSEFELPDTYPLHHTIGIDQTNIYQTEDIFPLTTGSPWTNVHTIFLSHDSEKVKNKTELAVTEDQIYSRSMIKSFVAAASCARRKFGSDVKHLPEPVTVQCVQSDGQNYHFSIYQLNTLEIDGTEGIKNFWWSAPTMRLFEKAQYENGRPILEGYNAEVFKTILAFYKNR